MNEVEKLLLMMMMTSLPVTSARVNLLSFCPSNTWSFSHMSFPFRYFSQIQFMRFICSLWMRKLNVCVMWLKCVISLSMRVACLCLYCKITKCTLSGDVAYITEKSFIYIFICSINHLITSAVIKTFFSFQFCHSDALFVCSLVNNKNLYLQCMFIGDD